MKKTHNYLAIFLLILISRVVPHPPNFTPIIALSFYIPALLGIRYLPALIVSFALTDLFIGFHGTALFTWGSVLFIGFLSKYFIKNIISRITGALVGACIFYVITNFGVWSLGIYGYTIDGIITCYVLAIPFFAYSLISTFIFSSIIEGVYKIQNKKIKNII